MDWTAERVRALPDDGKRYEVVDGELLVTPSPRLLHQRALGELLLPLAEHVRATGIGEVFFSPSDVEFDSCTMVQPDLFVVPLNEGRSLRDWSEIQRLLLAVEILSPSTARYDRLTKRRVYQREGVEYWIVDIDARVVERWRPGDGRPEILAERLEWQPDDGHPAWVLELGDYFDAVWGERETRDGRGRGEKGKGTVNGERERVIASPLSEPRERRGNLTRSTCVSVLRGASIRLSEARGAPPGSAHAGDLPLLRDRDPNVLTRPRSTALSCSIRLSKGQDPDCASAAVRGPSRHPALGVGSRMG